MISEPFLRWNDFMSFIHDEGLSEMDVPSIAEMDSGEALPEIGGRLCYMSFGKGRKTNKEYLDNIIKQRHFSVLEHSNWSFIITGVSRSFTHELVRHRHLSFSQLSQRYVDESEAEPVTPSAFADDARLVSVFNHAFGYAQGVYIGLVDDLERKFKDIESPTERRKAARQAARAILPNATETKIMVTGNARAWREFVEKRNSPHADPEIQNVARELLRQLHLSAPNLFADMVGGE
jgi:thymidylate synthase (FAD)